MGANGDCDVIVSLSLFNFNIAFFLPKKASDPHC